jgi:5-methylcytosine-specific restriction endonuclease McrA
MLQGGPTCRYCGHPGADQAGHILSAKDYPHLAKDLANRSPVHGWRGCPTCGAKCNQEAGTKTSYKPSPRSRSW